MKKVLIGVGIGCGVLLLAAVVVVGAGAFWAKRNLGGALEAGEQMAAQADELKKLNQAHPFTPPPDGTVLTLKEDRLDAYLAIREAALPVYKELEAKGEELDKKHQGGEVSVSDAMQAGSLLAQVMSKTRAAYIENLKKHRMSPNEFLAISGAIYNSEIANSMGEANQAMASQREGVETAHAEIQKQLQNDALSEEERTALEQQAEALQTQLDLLDSEGGQAAIPQVDAKTQGVAAANMALLAKFKGRIEKANNPGFDALLITDDMKNPYGNIGNVGQQQQ
jgi:cell division protein FtsB